MSITINRKLILTTALSILVIGGMGATLVFANPNGYSTMTTTTDRTRTVCFDSLRIVRCGPEPTTTVTVTANQTITGEGSAVTITQTAPSLDLAPFYDVSNGDNLLGQCLTPAQFWNTTIWTSATPDPDCHGVHN